MTVTFFVEKGFSGINSLLLDFFSNPHRGLLGKKCYVWLWDTITKLKADDAEETVFKKWVKMNKLGRKE